MDWRLSVPSVESFFLFAAIVGNRGGTVGRGVGVGRGTRARGRPGASMPSRRLVKRAGGSGRDAIGATTKLKIAKKPLRLNQENGRFAPLFVLRGKNRSTFSMSEGVSPGLRRIERGDVWKTKDKG